MRAVTIDIVVTMVISMVGSAFVPPTPAILGLLAYSSHINSACQRSIADRTQRKSSLSANSA